MKSYNVIIYEHLLTERAFVYKCDANNKASARQQALSTYRSGYSVIEVRLSHMTKPKRTPKPKPSFNDILVRVSQEAETQRLERSRHKIASQPLVLGPAVQVPLNREGFEIIRSPYGKSNYKNNKIIDKVYHGKTTKRGEKLWRIKLRTQRGTEYSTEYTRARSETAALKKIASIFYITRYDPV